MAATPADLAATLVRRHRRALEERRARAVEVRRRVEEVIAREARAGHFRRAFLIGSLAHGTFGARSDVDVVVEGLPVEQTGLLYGELVAATGVEVDLLRLEELSAGFRQRVESEGIALYGA